MNIPLKFLTFLYIFSPHSWFAIWRDSVITQDVPGSSETRNNYRTKSVSLSIEVDFRHFDMVNTLSTRYLEKQKNVYYRLKY